MKISEKCKMMAFVIGAFLISCQMPTDNPAGDPATSELATELRALSMPDGITADNSASEFTQTLISESEPEESYSTRDGIPLKTVVTLKQYSASAKYNTQVLLNPSSDVIYPGSVLIGSSISDGSYREVVKGEKNNITVSYGGFSQVRDDAGNQGKISGEMYPTLSSFRVLHNSILTQHITGVNSTYTLNESNVSTESAFEVHFSAGVTYSGAVVKASVKGNFDYKSQNSLNKYMISFAQTYFTVDVDQGEGTFMYKNFDIEDFEGVRPVPVRSAQAYITIRPEEEYMEAK
ncbi:MAG: thiol-activated cytolysin family protein [Spirochaetales bacterium]|nr:thiol-activated cytolysin family protein [Spirochaetales bacterium]